jgi:hypothetical protein
MKSYILFFIFMAVVVVSYAQPPDVPATPGSTYGKAINADGAFKISQLPAMLSDKDSADVKIEAKVIAVCPKMGCWMKLEMPDKSTVFVDMKDYAFFVPTALAGKTVAIEGNAKKVIATVKEQRHIASDAKKSKREIEAITEPKEELQLTATGIVVIQ